MKLPKELTTATPLSKYLARLVFIALPIVGFFFGMRYQEMVDLTKRQKMEANLSIPRTPTPTLDETANWKTYTNKTYGYSIKYPPNLNLFEKLNESGFVSNDAQVNIVVIKANSNESLETSLEKEYTYNRFGQLYSQLKNKLENTTIDKEVGLISKHGERIDDSLEKIAFVKRDSKLYIFHGYKGGILFDQILSTFQFFP